MHKLPHWFVTDKYPALYETESATAIEMVAKLYGAMNDLISEYNSFVDSINKNIEDFEASMTKDYDAFAIGLRQEFQDFINIVELKYLEQDKKIDDAIKQMTENLSEAIHTMLKDLIDSGELTDELVKSFEDLSEKIDTTFEELTERINDIEQESEKKYARNKKLSTLMEIADLEIYAQHFPVDGCLKPAQSMDVGVINGTPYMFTSLSGDIVNFVPYPYFFSDMTHKGLDVTVDNGSITFNGSPSSTMMFRPVQHSQNIVLSAGTYTISGMPSGESERVQMRIYEYASVDATDYSRIIANDTGEGATFTLENDAIIEIRINFLTASVNTEFSDFTITPMIEKGSIKHDVVPWVENPNVSEFSIYNLKTGAKITTVKDETLYHMNDVSFCGKDNLFYFTTDEESKLYHTYNVLTGELKQIECSIAEIDYIHGIAYNSNDETFYLYGDGKILKVDFTLTTVIKSIDYDKPNYSNWCNQGIYFDGEFLYKLNSRKTRDSEHSVFNHLEIFSEDMEYLKTINVPFSAELEGMSFYNGKYYFYYNCYSRCGLIFKGDIFATNDSHHTRDAILTPIGIERFKTYYTAYVGNYVTAKFFCDNTKKNPFCHVWAGCLYLNDTNKTYATIELVDDVHCEFECHGQTFTNLVIKGNGYKWSGYIRVENMNLFKCENITINSVEWGLYLKGIVSAELNAVNLDVNGFETAINAYDCTITFNGEYYNTASTTFVNSNRMVHLRFNTLPTRGATTFGCATFAMATHNIDAKSICGHSLYDTTLTNADNILNIRRNGMFIVNSESLPLNAFNGRDAIIHAKVIASNTILLEWYDRSRSYAENGINIGIAKRIMDTSSGFDSGWIPLAIESATE